MEERTGIKATNNHAELCGVLAGSPTYSHESRGERFFHFPIETERLSGTTDTINIIAREALLASVNAEEAPKLRIVGEVRSFNNKHSEGSRLVITVFAHELYLESGDDKNDIRLRGTLCKPPNLRVTPMGREICDLMLAVNRHYGRSDYIPCIAWGVYARDASMWKVGTTVDLVGRLQSRQYIKLVDGVPIEKTAFEVSVIEICEAPL